jgi:RNA polymerase sigma factor (sigma-70 family)
MKNIFSTDVLEDKNEKELVALAQDGNHDALAKLVIRHQEWIYNISVRMLGTHDDAQDVTQEILIKMITKLSTFQHKSSFKTWLYRIVNNHILNMKRNIPERLFSSFDKHSDFKDNLECSESTYMLYNPVEEEIFIEETKSLCLRGILLCLDRKKRLVFILGAIFGVNSKLGGQFLDISPDNFRKSLSRTRKQLSNFMNEKCGLINENNSCRCSTKTKSCIEMGLMNPDKLKFKKDYLQKINDFVSDKIHLVDDALEMKVQNIFRNQHLYKSPDYSLSLRRLLNQQDVNKIINY